MKWQDIALKDQNDITHTINQYSGKWVVLYAYPKDGTPGCTAQACTFRDLSIEFHKIGVVLLGISADSVESHKKFAIKHNLAFPLLADTNHELLEAVGAWKPKQLFGKSFLGVKRNTYLINTKGEIEKTYAGVNPLVNPSDVLKGLSNLISSTSNI